jgi:hypothetical protein
MAGTSQAKPATLGGTTVMQTVSAQPSATLTEAERKRRYAQLRERMGRPRLQVEGLPGRHYFWAPRGDSNELDQLDLLGYKIVREQNVKEVLAGRAEPKIRANGLKEDGTYVLGDVILMDCDEEVYEYLMLQNDEKSAAQQTAAKDNFVFEAEKKGVPVFEVDKSKVGR